MDDNRYLKYTTPTRRSLTLIVTTNGKGERKVFDIIEREYKRLYPGQTKVILKLLQAGDFEFIDDATNKPFGSLVERVTVEDLASKIGKERDQQMQQMHQVSRNHGVYIVEGNPMRLKNPTSQKAVFGRINTLPEKWKKDVYLVEDHETTAWLLINLHISLEHIDNKRMKEFDYDNSSIIAPPKNKAELRNEAKLQHLLTRVNGITSEKADSIARVYPTLTAFVTACYNHMKHGGTPETVLVDIEHLSGNSHRLGPAASREIAEFFEMKPIYDAIVGHKRENDKNVVDNSVVVAKKLHIEADKPEEAVPLFIRPEQPRLPYYQTINK